MFYQCVLVKEIPRILDSFQAEFSKKDSWAFCYIYTTFQKRPSSRPPRTFLFQQFELAHIFPHSFPCYFKIATPPSQFPTDLQRHVSVFFQPCVNICLLRKNPKLLLTRDKPFFSADSI